MGSFRDRIKATAKVDDWSSSILDDIENDPDKELKSTIERMLTSKYGDKQYSEIKNENDKQYFMYKKMGLISYKNCIERNSIEPEKKAKFQTEDSLEKLIGRFATECSKSTQSVDTASIKILPSVPNIIKQLLIEEGIIKIIDFLIEKYKNKKLFYDDDFTLQQEALKNLKTTVADGEIPYEILKNFNSAFKIKNAINRNITEWKNSEKTNTTGEITDSEEIATTMQKIIDEQNQERDIIDI